MLQSMFKCIYAVHKHVPLKVVYNYQIRLFRLSAGKFINSANISESDNKTWERDRVHERGQSIPTIRAIIRRFNYKGFKKCFFMVHLKVHSTSTQCDRGKGWKTYIVHRLYICTLYADGRD